MGIWKKWTLLLFKGRVEIKCIILSICVKKKKKSQGGQKKNGYRIYNFPTSRGEKMEKEKQSQIIENKVRKKRKRNRSKWYK